MENQKKESRLDGKWRVARKFVAGDDVGKSLTLYEDYFVEFAAGDTLIETNGNKVATSTYRFDAGISSIEILTTGAPSSPIFGAGSAIFRIVSLNDREIYLRSPYSVGINGEFETILLKKFHSYGKTFRKHLYSKEVIV